MMIGPNSSGRMAASIITAHPAWQLPMTQGLPSARGCSSAIFFQKDRFRSGDILDCLPRHWLRKEADKITGMTRP